MAIETIIRWFEQYAGRVPLELFVFVGSFTEEAISPIPSFVVLIPAGAAAHVQHVSWWYLPVLAFISSCGRIIASSLLYYLADKGEDVLLRKGRKLFGFDHAQIERFGKRLSGSWRDWMVLFLLNAVPVLPTAFLSVACGFIKVRFSLFVSATFIGATINALCYLSLGYGGIQVMDKLRRLESVFQIVVLVLVAVLAVLFFVYRRRRAKVKSSE